MKQLTLGVSVAVALAVAICLCSTSTTLHAQGQGNSTAQLCKNGGWRLATTAEGQPFKNQGACVSYATHGGEVSNAFAQACRSLPGTVSIDGSTVSCLVLPDSQRDAFDYLMKVCTETGGIDLEARYEDYTVSCTY